MTKLIFLDIDGVLGRKHIRRLNANKLARLSAALAATDTYAILLTMPSTEKLMEAISNVGNGRIFDIVADLKLLVDDGHDRPYNRGAKLAAWLTEHFDDKENWPPFVVISADGTGMDHADVADKFLLVDEEGGLTADIVSSAKNILAAQQ